MTLWRLISDHEGRTSNRRRDCPVSWLLSVHHGRFSRIKVKNPESTCESHREPIAFCHQRRVSRTGHSGVSGTVSLGVFLGFALFAH
ncbi:hypothetical protein R1flu_012649 [Riccia fluitans]|uniref:Uncharacterized protein n=1 Tax=Riccia fluitans TaxID=41844 RepID=A0ABD1ZFB9_9MARC